MERWATGLLIGGSNLGRG